MFLKKIKENKLFKFLTNFYIFILAIFLIWMYFFDSNVQLNREFDKEIKELKNTITFYKKEIDKDKKTIKEFFLNFQMLGLLFSPLILHFVGIYFVNPSIDINEIFAPFQPIINEIGIFYFQLIWIAVVGISLYIGAMLIALPIYIILYTLIIITLE